MDTAPEPPLGSRIRRLFEESDARPAALVLLLAVAAALVVAGRWYEPAGVAGFAIYAAVIAGAAELSLRASRAFRSRPLRIARAIVPPAIVIAVTVAQVWPAWIGARRMFLDQDHPTHLAGARYFLEQLGRGRFWQFSQLWNGGDAISDMYGWGGNLLVGAIRLASFGRLSLERAYQVAVAATFTACGLAMYALARRFARRPLALGLAIVPIHHLYWRWPLFFGTWHSQLATVLVLFGCARAIDAARRGRRRDALIGALCVAAAGVMHSFTVLATLFLGGSLIGAALLAGGATRRRAWLVAAPMVLGLGVAAFWIVPMTRGLATFAVHWPWRGEEDGQLVAKVVGEGTLNGVFFSAVAIVAATLHRDPMLRGLSFALVMATLFQRVGFEADLRLADLGFGASMQWFRVDAFLVLAAPAPMAALLEAALRRRPRGGPLRWERVAGRAVALAVLALAMPFAAAALRQASLAFARERPIRVRTDPPSLERVTGALAERRARDPAWPFRVLWTADANIQEVPAIALRARVPVMTLPGLPALTNQNRLRVATPEALRAWGVRYVVSDRASPPAPGYVLDATIGPYQLFRDDAYPGFVAAPPGVTAQVTAFDDEEVRIRVQGAPAGGAELRLAMAFYPRFRAHQDGQSIAVRALPERPGEPAMLVSVRARDGEIVLRPDAALPGTLAGFAITLLSLASLAALSFAHRAPQFSAALRGIPASLRLGAISRAIDRASFRDVGFAAGAALAVALLVVLAGRPRSSSPLPRAFGGDGGAVYRTGPAGEARARCAEHPLHRQWLCEAPGDDDVAVVQIATATDPPAPGEAWGIGRPFTGVRVEERAGRAIVHVVVRGFGAGRALHVRMEPVGAPPASLSATRGALPAVAIPIVHGWATVPLVAGGGDGGGGDAIDFALRFDAPGGLTFRARVDDDARNPPTAQVP